MDTLIPKPASVQTGDSSLLLSPRLHLHSESAEARIVIGVSRIQGQDLIGEDFRIVTERDDSCTPVTLSNVSAMTPESYRLVVDSGGIDVSASDQAGWFYGLQTLWQLLNHSSNELRHQIIEDFPRFSWRGLHLDVCRHFFDINVIKRLLDLMAIHKLNRFHWHLTEDQGWRMDIPQFPRLREVSAWRNVEGERYGGFYTHAEMREVVRYAKERCITVIPEVELPGHSLAALAAYPELGCNPGPFNVATEWGIFEDVYCAGKDRVFDFLKEVFQVTMDIFPGPYIHIGGDECPKTRWESCPQCQDRMKEQGLDNSDQLQSWFVQQIVSFLAAHGRRAIGWDEILEGGLPEGAMVMSWRGMDGGIAAAREGHDVIMSPTSHCYFDYRQRDAEEEPGFHGVITLRDVYDFDPLPHQLEAHESHHIIGAQANVWTERMESLEDLEFMILPRLSALSEVVWSPQADRGWDDFERRLVFHNHLLQKLNYRPRPLEMG